jgi:hypothetical protein
MNKKAIFITLFLYALIVLVDLSKPLWTGIQSHHWFQSVSLWMKEPLPSMKTADSTPRGASLVGEKSSHEGPQG